MADRPEDIPYLRGIAARLRSLAVGESRVADQLEQLAAETEERATQIEKALNRPAISRP
jgi:hypothetical protein